MGYAQWPLFAGVPGTPRLSQLYPVSASECLGFYGFNIIYYALFPCVVVSRCSCVLVFYQTWWSLDMLHLAWPESLRIWSNGVFCLFYSNLSRGQILRRNPDISIKSFPLCYSQSPPQRCLQISISSNSCNLLQFLQLLLYTVKEKGEKPDRKPENHTLFPIQKPQVWELSRLCPETLTKL